MSVVLAYVHPGSVTHTFMQSVVGVLSSDRADQRITGVLPIRFRPSGICDARNQGVSAFLKTGADWLWFADTDMGFLPDTLCQLVDAADPVERPVVGALCFGVREEAEDGFGGFRTRTFPTLHLWSDAAKTFLDIPYVPESQLVRVDGTGTACILIHRSVLEAVREEYGPVWFHTVRDGGGAPLGEDLSFCYRLRTLDIPVHVHTGIPTTHQKTQWVREAPSL